MLEVIPFLQINFFHLKTANDIHDSEVLTSTHSDIFDVAIQRNNKCSLPNGEKMYIMNAISFVEYKLIAFVELRF
jgi:hypothetical protein